MTDEETMSNEREESKQDLRDRLFPSEGNPDLVQTEWSEDWSGVTIGFGYAAEYLTENRTKFGATIDHVGLPILFLQRHRLEASMKAALDTLGREYPKNHLLVEIWDALRTEVLSRDSEGWKEFEDRFKQFIEIMDDVDPGSMTFRYPVDRQGNKHERPKYIDLDAINKVAESFENMVSVYAERIVEHERDINQDFGEGDGDY
jgi:HEPN domain-containing protein